MAAYPAYTVTFNLKDDCANYPITAPAAGGQNPDTTTAISADTSARIKALLAPFASGAVTITQA